MKIRSLFILICLLSFSCQKERTQEPNVDSQEAKISIITLICDNQTNPGCNGTLIPAMGATIKLYALDEDRTHKINEIATIYTDHEGKKALSVDPGYYYIYTLHKGREVYTEEKAINRTTSFHEVIILE